MSFILDALRKSEHERERRALPGLVDLPVSRASPPRLPWILGGVGALLVANIGVLLFVLLRPAPPPAVPAVPAPAAASAAPAAAPPAPPPARLAASASPRAAAPSVRPLAAETEPADPSLDATEPERPPARPAPEPFAAERAAAAAEFRRGVTVAGVPSIHELAPQATAGLPALNIDLHVYAADPAQRFVIINGQRVREGGALKEGPAVERITEDGAVLNYQGTRFLLPRE